MSDSRPAADVARGIEAVSQATVALMTALRDADPGGMRRALERRGEAIESLRAPLLELGRAVAEHPELAAEKRRLDRQAAGAIDGLQQLASQIRAALDQLGRDANAVRSYGDQSLPATVLDRSG